MGRQFDTYAERYRAQTEQAPQEEGLAPEEIHAIGKDLAFLGNAAGSQNSSEPADLDQRPGL